MTLSVEPVQLFDRVSEVTRSALAIGALGTIPTRCIARREGRLDFEIRVVGN